MQSVKLVVGNIYTTAEVPDTSAESIIQTVTTYVVESYVVRKWTGSRAPEKVQKRFRFGTGTLFPTGHLWRVKRILENSGYTVGVVDERTEPSRSVEYKMPKHSLRPYQQRTVDVYAEAGRGTIEIPTGGGKTLIASHLIYDIGVKTLYIVPNRLLLNQVHQDLSKYFGKRMVGRVGEGVFEPRAVTVATAQTLHVRKESPDVQALINSSELLIIDECHVIGAASGRGRQANIWYEVARACPAYYRFGMSATPGSATEMRGGLLRGMTGGVLVRVSASDLIDEGFLAQPEVLMYHSDCRALFPPRFDFRNWREVNRRCILENTARNTHIAEIAAAFARGGKSVLITVGQIEKHGQPLYEMLPPSITSFVTGGTHRAERKAAIDRFKSKATPILIGTIFKMGFNVPSMDVLILADAGRKEESVAQRVGRVLRFFKGKRAVVVDFLDDDNSVALKHSLYRLKYYLSERSFIVDPIGFKIEEVKARRPDVFQT